MARSRAAAAPANNKSSAAPARAGRAVKPQQQNQSADEHGVKDVRAALEALGATGWGDTEERQFTEIPPGKYQAQIKEATINHAKSSGRLQVSWTLEILTGEFTGRNVWCHDGIEDEDNRSFFRGKLARIGLEWPSTPTDLPDTLQQAVDSYVQITIKQKGEFTNVYFDKALDSADLDVATEEASASTPPAAAGRRGASPPPPPPAAAAAGDEPTEASFAGGVSDDDVTGKHRREIKEIAKKLDIDPDRYDNITDLMLDVAETLEVFGEFESPEAIMTAIKEAAK